MLYVVCYYIHVYVINLIILIILSSLALLFTDEENESHVASEQQS